MENPTEEISSVIKALCQGTIPEQQRALSTYFLPDASFTHPFCRVPSIKPIVLPLPLSRPVTVSSRDVIAGIYRWYRFLSPNIDLDIDSHAHDRRNHILYVSVRQRFTIWFVPFYSATVRLVVELHLSQQRPPAHHHDAIAAAGGLTNNNNGLHGGRQGQQMRWYIAKQEDHYQVNEFLKFVLPFVGPLLWFGWQVVSSLLCFLLTLPLVVLDRTLKRKEQGLVGR